MTPGAFLVATIMALLDPLGAAGAVIVGIVARRLWLAAAGGAAWAAVYGSVMATLFARDVSSAAHDRMTWPRLLAFVVIASVACAIAAARRRSRGAG